MIHGKILTTKNEEIYFQIYELTRCLFRLIDVMLQKGKKIKAFPF